MASPDLGWFTRQPKFKFDLFQFMVDDSKSDAHQKDALLQYLESRGLHADSQGAYAFSADIEQLGHEKAGFLYPFGRSRIYYVGKTDDPYQRFLTHFSWAGWAAYDLERHSEGAYSNPARLRHHPLYAYAAKFGAWVYWWNARRDETPEDLETRLMMAFYRKFGSIPVANLRWSKLEATAE